MYGYIKCRIKISNASGLNNAVWLFSNHKGTKHRFEIDIAEIHFPNKIYFNIHDLGSSQYINKQFSTHIRRKNLSNGYHIYAVDWERDSIKFYIDGEIVRSDKNLFCHEPATLSLSTAVLKWAGPITERINKTKMSIDYIRVYMRKEDLTR